MIQDRFEKAYSFLVDETENPDTIFNKQRHNKLSDLLELFEYLRGEEEDNPLEKWFTSQERPDPHKDSECPICHEKGYCIHQDH